MEVRARGLEELAQLRMRECQGTFIGGLRVAQELGCDAERFGYLMMMLQPIRWDRMRGNLEKITAVFEEHYQAFYEFAPGELVIDLRPDSLLLKMPSVTRAAAGQLSYWRVEPAAYRDLQRGLWRAIAEGAEVDVEWESSEEGDRILVRRRAS